MAEHLIQFDYNTRGRGTLRLRNDSLIELFVKCRTGSIGGGGRLKNAIAPGVWSIQEPCVDTDETAMQWEPGKGWKARLYTPEGEWSHYLIHPDGGKVLGNGTLGCIGTQGTYIELRQAIDKILTFQDVIKVYINDLKGVTV
jgi:hypothetical protein